MAPGADPSNLDLLKRAALSGAVHPLRAGRVALDRAPAAVTSLPRRLRSLGASERAPLPSTRFNQPLTAHRVFDARFYDLDDVKRIKKRVEGATINDVALAHVGGGLRLYLDAHGELPEVSLVAGCPISIRTTESTGKGGNMLSAMIPPLRTDIADPTERLQAITAATSKDRVARKGVKAPALLEVAELLPGALLGLGARALSLFPNGAPPIVNIALTNVPGAPVPLYFCGARLVRMAGAGPLVPGIGLIQIVGTYDGGMCSSFTADRQLMPDPERYGEALDTSFAALLSSV